MWAAENKDILLTHHEILIYRHISHCYYMVVNGLLYIRWSQFCFMPSKLSMIWTNHSTLWKLKRKLVHALVNIFATFVFEHQCGRTKLHTKFMYLSGWLSKMTNFSLSVHGSYDWSVTACHERVKEALFNNVKFVIDSRSISHPRLFYARFSRQVVLLVSAVRPTVTRQ